MINKPLQIFHIYFWNLAQKKYLPICDSFRFLQNSIIAAHIVIRICEQWNIKRAQATLVSRQLRPREILNVSKKYLC